MSAGERSKAADRRRVLRADRAVQTGDRRGADVVRFLEGEALGTSIRTVMSGADRRCAVAFWGRGACDALFEGRRVAKSARVVCDIGMGGTNPDELKKMGAPGNANVRHVPGLHAKLYLSERGAVIGSANASENGIGFTAEAGLTEAAVHVPAGCQAHLSAGEWFDALFEAAEVVDDAVLSACTEAWKRRSASGRADGGRRRPATPNSLLDAVRDDPARFRGVGFVFTNGFTSRATRDLGSAAILDEDAARDVAQLTADDRELLPQWHTGHVFSGWAREDVSGWPERFICAHQGRSIVRYWFYERRHAIHLGDDEGGVVFAAKSSTLKRELGLGSGASAMADADRRLLKRIFAKKRSEGRRLYVNGDELARALAELEGPRGI